jgi:hypothetical protein
MSLVMVTLFLFIVMLLIIGCVLISAGYAQRRQMRQRALSQEPLAAPTGRMMVVMQLQDGSMVGVERPAPLAVTRQRPDFVPSAHLSSRWYRHQRMIVSLGLLCMVVIGLSIQTGVAGEVFHTLTQNITAQNVLISGTGVQTAFQAAPHTASANILRVDSAARNQYYTDYQYQVWSFSSCSGIALEEVMNAYGRHYIAADVLQVEANLGIWNTYDGLTGGEPGMARTAAYFGFQASSQPPRTLQDLIAVTNQGFPVIVGSPGHILVVKGGDARYVYLVDSAPANRTLLTYAQFQAFWDGFSVLIVPK